MRWSYKTVHFGMKKDGILGSAFLDESEIEVSLNDYGKAGWELVSFTEVSDGLIGVFKQPFSRGIPRLEEASPVEEVPIVAASPARSPEFVTEQTPTHIEEEDESYSINDNEDEQNNETDVGSIRIT